MNVLRRINRERFQMDFLVHTTKLCAYDDEIKSLGSQVIPCLHPSRPWRYARNFRRAVGENGDYDIVHSHVYLFSGFVLRIAHQMGIPGRIAHMYPHVDLRGGLARPAYKWLMNALLHRHATHILACSETTLEAVRRSHAGFHRNSSVVWLGIELERFTTRVDKNQVRKQFGLPTDTPLVIYVARFAPHKNHAQVVRVADLLGQRGTKAHYVMVGSSGPLLSSYQQLASERADVSVLANVEDIAPLLGASDLFFFPSLNEGFGMVAIEAAAAGLPVVASDLPTIREACPPGHRDLMFPPDDDEAACRSLVSIMSDDNLKRCLIEEGKRWVVRFSVEESIRSLTSAYRNCLSR